MIRLRNIAAHIRAQLWLIPTLMMALGGVLAFFMLEFGAIVFRHIHSDVWWIYSGGPDSARNLLSSFLAGLMTMTSLVVSVTFVILTLAASQLGPRLILLFIGDKEIQAVLGLFLGTILYLIIVLRTLDDLLGPEGVPHGAITVASILTIGCLCALLFYIQKISKALIADNVVEAVSNSLQQDLRMIMRKNPGAEPAPPVRSGHRPQYLSIGKRGYVQMVDYDWLIEVARKQDAQFEIKVRAGHYLLRAGDHVCIFAHQTLSQEAEDAIRSGFVIGRQRTPAQDMEHGIRQLVEIALRALSPGVNDPFTAIAVVDRLGAALEDIFHRPLQPETFRDEAGEIRVIASRSDAPGLINSAFDAIRQAGRDAPAVLIRIADVLGQLAFILRNQESEKAALEQLEKLEGTAQCGSIPEADRLSVLERIDNARETIVTVRRR
jgi:uncharacterized membrane protein